MEADSLIERLLSLPDLTGQGVLLRAALEELGETEVDELAEGLKEKVIRLQMADTQLALRAAGLILELAELTQNPLQRALGLRAKAQTLVIGLGEYQQALPVYEQALEIYRQHGDEVGQALVENTRIWALASLGRYEEAIRAGEWAGRVLESHAYWLRLAHLHNNLAWIYQRAGDSIRALDLLEAAHSSYQKSGMKGEPFLASNQLSRAYLLYLMGRLEESIQVSHSALNLAESSGQSIVSAQAKHNLGITYFRIGKHNQALNLFEEAREVHLANGQRHEAALCELSSAECLLELRRFKEALDKCHFIYQVFSDLGMSLEAAQTRHLQGQAYAHIRAYPEAIEALGQARQLFSTEGNQYWINITQLEIAMLLYLRGEYAECLRTAQENISAFETIGTPVEAIRARIVAARAASALNDLDIASQLISTALAKTEALDLPLLDYQGYHLLGQLAEAQRDRQTALLNYERATQQLERVRGNVITEYQAAFLEDKGGVYERMVDLYLQMGKVDKALEFAERAKSRALLELLAGRINVRLETQQASDEPLVTRIEALRVERERLLRQGRRIGEEKFAFEPASQVEVQRQVQQVEEQITEGWNRLLVHNAAYSLQASLWQVHVEPAQPYLNDETALLEYFRVGGDFVAFLISNERHKGDKGMRAWRLPAKLRDVEGLLQRLRVNLHSVPASRANHLPALIENAQRLLHQLYQRLVEPIKEAIAPYPYLIIVPHGPLHYLPFHALFDGQAYLIERHQVNYLPAASFLRHVAESNTSGNGFLAVGYSSAGELPYAVIEANQVAETMGGQVLLEGQSTLARVKDLVSEQRGLHFACHGEFRADKPLFSGLELADGWLTTFDIFNLRLKASLVTLSACQTGRSVVGGGDELQGLMRSFLVAGAKTLVLSHWAVEDRSTSELMQAFCNGLIAGETKASALREAQLSLITKQAYEQDSSYRYQHPYYWAPFFLVGDAGHL